MTRYGAFPLASICIYECWCRLGMLKCLIIIKLVIISPENGQPFLRSVLFYISSIILTFLADQSYKTIFLSLPLLCCASLCKGRKYYAHESLTVTNLWSLSISGGLYMGCSITSYYHDVITGAVASQITSLKIVYSTVYSGADQRKHQSSASLVFVREIHRGLVNSTRKWPVTRKVFPFDDVIMGRWRLDNPQPSHDGLIIIFSFFLFVCVFVCAGVGP